MTQFHIQEDTKVILNKYMWPTDYTIKYLDLGATAIDNVLRSDFKEPNSTKTKVGRLSYLRILLDRLEEAGIFPTPGLIVTVSIDRRDPGKFIQEHSKDNPKLVLAAMNSSVEKFKNGLLERDFFEEYHEKYGPQVNEETLSRVALDEPLFLGQMIDYGKLDNYTKALALSQLGVDADDQVYGTIYSKLNDPAPIVREGAYQGIVHYYIKEQEDNEPLEEKDRARKYSKLPMMLEDNLKNETSPAVQGQIREILEVMAFYS